MAYKLADPALKIKLEDSEWYSKLPLITQDVAMESIADIQIVSY